MNESNAEWQLGDAQYAFEFASCLGQYEEVFARQVSLKENSQTGCGVARLISL